MDNLSRLDWSDLHVILAIGECGGAAHAARALGISHQTVSRRLGRLEDVLGLRLVNRERHPWVLTVKGLRICEHAARMHAVMQDVARYVQSEEADKVKCVSIACNAWGFDLLVLPALKELQQIYPELTFKLITGDTPLDIQSGEADIALRFTDEPPPDLLGRRVGYLSMGVFGRPNYIAAIDTNQINDVPVIQMEQQKHNRIWSSSMDHFHKVITVNDFSTLVSAVRQGLGVAAMPIAVGQRCHDLIRSETIILGSSRSVWLLRNRDSRGSKVIWSVEDAIVKLGKKTLLVA